MWRTLASRTRLLARQLKVSSGACGNACRAQVHAIASRQSSPYSTGKNINGSASLSYLRPSLHSTEDYSSPEVIKSATPEHNEIERLPLPPGVSGDKFGLYELLNTSRDWNKISGENAVVAVHGPEELWAPEGTKNEGAAGGVFAVVAAGGTQYRVMPGDVLYTNRRPGDINELVKLTEVLMVGAYDWSVFGRPLIRGAYVTATIEEQTLSGKVIVAKFKKRKGYRRRKGHRQPITRMRIEEVKFEFPGADDIKPYEVEYDPNRPPLPNHRRFF